MRGAVTDLGVANLTTRTTSAILLPPSTFATIAQRCASLNEKVWSPALSNFSLGLDNALSYTAYVNANNGSIYYFTDSPDSPTSCNAITINGTAIQKPCNVVGPGLCTNSGPITQATESFPRPDLQVTVQSGNQNLTGYRDFYGFQFRGIRFSPKVDRFEYATVYEGSGAVDALKYGPGCLQADDPRWPLLDEDCQFLNIWTPYLSANSSGSAQRNKLKAVLIWITGGGNLYGTGTDTEKEGGNLASRGDIVVVSINYRVGNLGFLPFNDGIHNGNYAVSDMVAALEWVYKNIENFGGDPQRITIWGNSAGAVNVRTLLAIPQVEEMIAGGIMQSSPGEVGAAIPGVRYESPAWTYDSVTKKVLQESGCANTTTEDDDLSCLRAYNASKWWLEPGRTQAYNAIRDNHFLFTRGLPLSGPLAHPHKIPLMYGFLRDEWSYQFTVPTTNFSQNLEFGESIGFPVGGLENSSFAPERDPRWPTFSQTEKENAVFNASSLLSTALIFKCLPHAFAAAANKHGVFDAVYEFQFNRTYTPARFDSFAGPVCGRYNEDPDQTEYYKCHAGEVPYTFGNILQQGWPDRDGLDTAFARLVVDYWSAFARTGEMKPEDGYLEARGYLGSLEKMREAGVWSGDAERAMRLQWTGIGTYDTEEYKVGCDELKQPEDYYDGVDFSGDE